MYETRDSEGFALAGDLTMKADRRIMSLLEGCYLNNGDQWSIIALGGYGRRELCPFSDLDILFLIEKQIARSEIESALKEILYPLWDSGFNASYSVRTIKQAVYDAKNDFFFRTSLIDARFICGSETVFSKFSEKLSANRHLNNRKAFFSDLAGHTRRRHEKFGDSVYFLEPHLKDGHGGLRDYQSILWTIKILGKGRDSVQTPVSDSDLAELIHAADFMLKIRFKLHNLTGRKTDQMHLEYQEMLASEIGYQSTPDATPVEAFLKDFHTRALTVRSIFDSLLHFLKQPSGFSSLLSRTRHDEHFTESSGLLSVSHPESLDNNPVLLLKTFARMAGKGLSLTPLTRSRIKALAKEGASWGDNPQVNRLFLKVLQMKSAENALTTMLETGVIERLIPEFSRIRGKTIFDVYHTYTIDLHSIHAVCELKNLEKTEEEAFGWVNDTEVLFFSTFLHDIGKGYGTPHAALGSDAVKAIAESFGFDMDRVDLISFLIRNHLLLADIASKRDLSEEKVISKLAQEIGDPSKLSMLYLLTIADSKATGPNAWNEWKASLLRELYMRTLNILDKGILKNRKNAMKLDEKWHKLIALSETSAGASFSGRLWALPQAYVLASDLDDIKRHLSLSSELKAGDSIKIEIVHRKNHVLLTIITRDRPGLFSLLSGILAVKRIEIISAKIFTWYDGTVVDTFQVLPPWHDYKEWHVIEKLFREHLSGEMDIETKLARTRVLKNDDPALLHASGGNMCAIDNETSDFFTIIDIRARKHIGLIHNISRIISSYELDIHRAFLSCSSDLSYSVFYVVDGGGNKLTDENRQQAVLENIRNTVSAPRLPASPEDKNRL